jgi:hypothetical protein
MVSSLNQREIEKDLLNCPDLQGKLEESAESNLLSILNEPFSKSPE